MVLGDLISDSIPIVSRTFFSFKPFEFKLIPNKIVRLASGPIVDRILFRKTLSSDNACFSTSDFIFLTSSINE